MSNFFILLSYAAQWDPLSRKLTGDGHKLVAVNDNLVDLVWDDQSESPNNSVIVQPIQYTGKARSSVSGGRGCLRQ